MIETTYTKARADLNRLFREVTENRETVIIARRGAGKVAMMPAEELSSLLETIHLFKSPRNATRLIEALDQADKGTTQPQTLEELARDMGLSDADHDAS